MYLKYFIYILYEYLPLHNLMFSHSFLKYPLESQISLNSERRGCFEPPSEIEDPNKDIDCPDILPIEHPDNITNYAAMDTPCQIDHPDCSSMQRYVMGTRLQTKDKGKKKKHKLKTCEFHNLDNSKQGAQLKTMSQGKRHSVSCWEQWWPISGKILSLTFWYFKRLK